MKRIKVSTYARMKEKSTQWVYDEIEKGNVEFEKIDGVMFILIKK